MLYEVITRHPALPEQSDRRGPRRPRTGSLSEKTEFLGCNSVLFLIKTLANHLIGSPKLWLVTRGSQAVRLGDRVDLNQSQIWGFGKVISFELPELNCIRIDLDPEQSINESVITSYSIHYTKLYDIRQS